MRTADGAGVGHRVAVPVPFRLVSIGPRTCMPKYWLGTVGWSLTGVPVTLTNTLAGRQPRLGTLTKTDSPPVVIGGAAAETVWVVWLLPAELVAVSETV